MKTPTPPTLLEGAYQSHRRKKYGLLLISLGITLLLFCIHLFAGASHMTFGEVLRALFFRGEASHAIILWNIRMPRALSALLAGAGLALCGCVMQTTLKNPMASPSTLGVSNAAVFGANVAIVFWGAGQFQSTHGALLSVTSISRITLCAFGMAFLSVLFMLFLSSKTAFSPGAVVLSGVATGALFDAGTNLVQYFAMDTQISAAVFWTFGDLGRVGYTEVLILAICVVVVTVYFICKSWDLNTLTHGEDTARSLGVRVSAVRFFALLLSSLVCALCVSFFGIIGFVGLVAPQAVKRFVGIDHRFLLPLSALSGSALLLLADILSRTMLKDISLPVGAITALFGAPLFLYLILHKKGGAR